LETIFVVDDDPDQAELLAAALGSDGRRVRAFSDPIRALGALASERADLLIADLSMPWIDGAQVVAAARAHRPDLSIILISGYARGAQVAQEENLTFLAKPIDLEQLRTAVHSLLHPEDPSAAQHAP
jgi:two-component system response regulator GlrR